MLSICNEMLLTTAERNLIRKPNFALSDGIESTSTVCLNDETWAAVNWDK